MVPNSARGEFLVKGGETQHLQADEELPGGVKQLNSTIPQYAAILAPFEKLVGSRGSSERIQWTEPLIKAFEEAKKAAANPEGVYIPRRSDRLITSSDYSQSTKSVGGLLTILREEGGEVKTLLGGHFSCTLDKYQINWSVCGVLWSQNNNEAL